MGYEDELAAAYRSRLAARRPDLAEDPDAQAFRNMAPPAPSLPPAPMQPIGPPPPPVAPATIPADQIPPEVVDRWRVNLAHRRPDLAADPNAPVFTPGAVTPGALLARDRATSSAEPTSQGGVAYKPKSAAQAAAPPTARAATPPGPNPLLSAYDREAAAARELTSAEQKQAEDASVAAALKAQKIGEQAADIEAKAKSRDAELAAQQAKIDKLSEDYSKERVDPEHWWHSRSTGQKIAFALAAALGGFAAGFRGGPNTALEQMNRAIDADIDAQKTAMANKRVSIENQKGALAEMYKRFGNMDQAETAARLVSLQQLDLQAQQYAVGSNSEVIAARGQALQAQIAKEKAALEAKLQSGGGGSNIEAMVVKRMQDIRDKSGGTISIDDARKQAIAEITGQTGVSGGYSKPDAESGALNPGPVPGSTSVLSHPLDAASAALGIRGTEGYNKKLQREQYNATVMGIAHKVFGARTPEAQREIMGGYILDANDDDTTIANKKAALVSKFGHGAAAPPNAQPFTLIPPGEDDDTK